ncbi:MAG: hypothetical protein JJE40_11860, partial [Vicinamibacteria bacterium]|nr:hypothetical protein [Vicinamibacteria bacterium]
MTLQRRFLCGAALIVGILTVAAIASAQTTSTITGRVTDASGGVLPGVMITARNLET